MELSEKKTTHAEGMWVQRTQCSNNLGEFAGKASTEKAKRVVGVGGERNGHRGDHSGFCRAQQKCRFYCECDGKSLEGFKGEKWHETWLRFIKIALVAGKKMDSTRARMKAERPV